VKRTKALEAAAEHLEEWTNRLLIAQAGGDRAAADLAEQLVSAYAALVVDLQRAQVAGDPDMSSNDLVGSRPMHTLTTGDYVTERDGGINYFYAVAWHRQHDTIVWEATVERKGVSPRVVQGTIQTAGEDSDVEAVVKESIHQTIEQGCI